MNAVLPRGQFYVRFKDGDIEWMDRAKALLKDHRFSHTICIG